MGLTPGPSLCGRGLALSGAEEATGTCPLAGGGRDAGGAITKLYELREAARGSSTDS